MSGSAEKPVAPDVHAATTSATKWQVQSAKQRFSELLRMAEGGQPQIITRHGKDVAVVIDIDQYRDLPAPDFKAYLAQIPRGDDLTIDDRVIEPEHDIALDAP